MGDKKRFCPNCGSENVEPDSSNAAYMSIGGNPNTWKCNSCNFTGLIPERKNEEDEQELDQISFEPEEDYPREDLGYGKGYMKYFLYISIPFFLIILGVKLLF